MKVPFLEQTMRWFGPRDAVTLAHIRQAGATGVVTALHELACGEVWPVDLIRLRNAEITAAGLRWSVVESVPVHEAIKQNTADAAMYLDRYRQSLQNLAACGIHVVCYNFMAVTDWTRTNLAMPMPGGAEALRFDAVDAATFDLHLLKRRGAEAGYTPAVREAAERRFSEMTADQLTQLSRTILLGLPGTVDNLTVEQFQGLLDHYAAIDSAKLREHHRRFLEAVIPTAESCGVVLAIHPDDPPFPMFGLPRIVGDEDGLRQIIQAVDSPSNGITFCTGSLGARPGNDLPGMLKRLGHRVHFLHLRNVKREPDGSFFEDDHLAGDVNMPAVMREAIALMQRIDKPLPMRPDHGHRMLGDLENNNFYAGYSTIGRLKGLAELRGLEVGLRTGAGS
ncbi:MAG: uxuA [Phycisphaerales bacterium]|nr:uxuA [Phycisphaerales bacterium]